MFDRVKVFTHIHIHKTHGVSKMAEHPKITKGEVMVNMGFNPSEKVSVDQFKGSTAALIDALQTLVLEETPDGDARRCANIAQQKYEEACMYAVKALTR